MSILHAISGLGGGGAENLLLDVATELHARGILQRVLFYSNLRKLEPGFAKLGIETILIDHEALGTARAFAQTRREIQAFAPALIHTHLMRADLIGRSAGLSVRGLPCFTTVHNLDLWRTQRDPFSLMLRLFDRATINHSRRTQMIAVSEACRQYCIDTDHLRPEKIITLRNFTSSRPEKQGAGVTRASLGLRDDDLVLVNAGRLQPQKRQMDILRTALCLRERGVEDIKFLILGDGELRDELEAFVREHALAPQVKLVGFVENVYDYFDISNAFLLASQYEGAPIVLLEAFHHGLAVVSSDIAPSLEMAHDGAGLLTYPLGQVDALAGVLLGIRDGRYDLAALVEKGHAYESALTPQRYVDELLAVYRAHGVSL